MCANYTEVGSSFSLRKDDKFSSVNLWTILRRKTTYCQILLWCRDRYRIVCSYFDKILVPLPQDCSEFNVFVELQNESQGKSYYQDRINKLIFIASVFKTVILLPLHTLSRTWIIKHNYSCILIFISTLILWLFSRIHWLQPIASKIV